MSAVESNILRARFIRETERDLAAALCGELPVWWSIASSGVCADPTEAGENFDRWPLVESGRQGCGPEGECGRAACSC